MSSSARRINDAVAEFLAGGPFETLWRDIIDDIEIADVRRELSATDQARYQTLHDLVYMGAPDPVCPDDEAGGLVGAAELRDRLRALHPLDEPT
jgi:hypothetical protein